MNDNRQDLLRMVRKYLAGKATPEEITFLESYYAVFEHEPGFTSRVEAAEKRLLEEQMEAGIWALVDARPKASVPVRRLWYRVAAAASILLAVSAGGYFLLHKSQPKAQAAAVHDVQPGGNKAFLVLGNGQRISLTDAKQGMIASQAGKTIQKTADGRIVYEDAHSIHNSGESIFNTVETPVGGQYQVVLPDGSKVWLNAASSLHYPAQFTGVKREVQLTGEAYFEVAKDKAHPFVVRADGQEVEVLGTHFDVNAYKDEPAMATTLLEGSVRVTTGMQQQVIKPGEQALNRQGTLQVKQVNTETIIDWKNGDFFLNRVDFRVAMRKIARWYNVEVVYAADVPEGIEAGGWIARDKPISEVLKAMERSGIAHFKVDGRKIYVSK